MRYRAAAALPCDDAAEATLQLQRQLEVIAAAGGRLPDWSTLAVDGPSPGEVWRGQAWFEFTATVEGTPAPRDADPAAGQPST
jgi:hypothetical protein